MAHRFTARDSPLIFATSQLRTGVTSLTPSTCLMRSTYGMGMTALVAPRISDASGGWNSTSAPTFCSRSAMSPSVPFAIPTRSITIATSTATASTDTAVRVLRCITLAAARLAMNFLGRAGRQGTDDIIARFQGIGGQGASRHEQVPHVGAAAGEGGGPGGVGHPRRAPSHPRPDRAHAPLQPGLCLLQRVRHHFEARTPRVDAGLARQARRPRDADGHGGRGGGAPG